MALNDVKDVKGADGFLGNPIQCILWFLKSICIPMSIPFFIMRYISSINIKKQRARLRDKVVVITGASSGIGEAMAHHFYAQGCRLVLAARRIDELNRVKADLLSIHSTVPTHPPVVMQIDLSELNNLTGHVAKILEMFGHIDILINNGGISFRGHAATTNIDVDIKVMLVNYFAQIALTKAVIQPMIERKSGHLVYMSSLQGKVALPYRSAYGASKHALQSFCDSLRSEIKKHNIKVTVISPTYVKTSLSVNALTGSGDRYGHMDEKTNKGISSDEVARITLDAVAREQSHVYVAPLVHRMVVHLRSIFPSVYEKILVHIEKTSAPS